MQLTSAMPLPVRFLVSFGALCVLVVAPATAQTPPPPPAPSPSPSASAPPAPRPLGLSVSSLYATTLIDQNTAGPGQVGPEATGFIAGSPVSPNTPYDVFSSAPLVPGVAGIFQGTTTVTERTPRFDMQLAAGIGAVDGSITNAAYWAESLLPALNPHLGAQALPYAIAFPTAPGQDDGDAVRLSLLGGSVATADGDLTVSGGWFDLAQTSRFVFIQPMLTSVSPAIAYAPAESLNTGLAGGDVWQPLATQLPLDGVDVVAKRGLATLEIANAALPALPGSAARATIASLFVDHGEGTHYALEYAHADTSGAAFTTTVPFGADPRYLVSPQGTLPTSILSGQQQTIVGASAAFHVLPGWSLDGVLEVGRAWYDAQSVALPGTSSPGGYYHAGLDKTFGRATATFDAYRMEPRYATMILPYGVAENQWSAAFAWPGQWLKSNYQLIDNSTLGVNRQGYRFRYAVGHGRLEWRLEYTNLYQIERETTITAEQTGFVDGYYLPQAPADATLGRQQRFAAWIAWHPSFGDVTLDVVDDQLNRPALVPTDLVDYQVPQAVVTYARHLSPAVTVAVGEGRYAVIGTFSEPIDFRERLFFAGTIVQETPQASLLATFRRSIFGGIPTTPNAALLPDFTGSLLILEQRYRF